MRITHGHRDGGMPEDAVQAEDITTGHHVMAGKSVAQDVSQRPKSADPGALISPAKCRTTGHKQPTIAGHPQLKRQCLHLRRNGQRTRLAVFAAMEVRFAAIHGFTLKRFGLTPTATRSTANKGDRIGVRIRRLAALCQQFMALLQGQTCQLRLIGFDLADIGQRINAMLCHASMQANR
jgi:hypothetical protein